MRKKNRVKNFLKEIWLLLMGQAFHVCYLCYMTLRKAFYSDETIPDQKDTFIAKIYPNCQI